MNERYTAVEVGGFSLGDFSSIAKAKKAIKERGTCGRYYQVIDNNSRFAIWEGYKK